MLTIHRASRPTRAKGLTSIGLAVAGGGPLGAIFELGVLRALDENVEGLILHELDVYVGVSAVAIIAASLANGISTAQMCRIFMGDEYEENVLDPDEFLRPAYREYASRVSRLPGILTSSVIEMLRHPGRVGTNQLLGKLGKIIPSGFFDNARLHDFIERVFTSAGRKNDFRELEARLFVIAVELDNGAAVRFGGEGWEDVPISRAVQASAALPGMYPPVEIDGRHFVDGALRRTLHASVALDEGVDLLFGINPLVPFDNRQRGRDDSVPAAKLLEGGLPLILSQTFRSLIQSRMKVGFAKYRDSHPAADLLLVEPNSGDEQIFFTNVFSFASRAALCEHAYQCTRQNLLRNADAIDALLERHGMGLRMHRLSDPGRTLLDGLGHSRHSSVSRELSLALEELEDAIDSQRPR